MMLKAALLIFLFASVITVHSDDINSESDVETDPELEKYLKDAIENFREQMKEGIDAINMPRLDPLNLRNLDVNVDENLATMNLQIKEISVNCLSLFNITYLKVSLEDLYLAVNLTLPELYLTGHYDLNGKLLKIFPIYGSGPFEINATEICICGKGQLQFSNGTLEMSLLKLDLLWKNITISLDNFLRGEDFSAVMQRIIPVVGKDVILAFKPLILEVLEGALTRQINEKLNDPLVKGILDEFYYEEY